VIWSVDRWLTISINKEYIEARIRELNDSIQLLRELTTKDFGKLTLYEKLAMRYLVIQIVESASSICVHILLNVFKEKVEGFPECFVRLQLKNILPKDLAEKLSSAARLRNLLVHRYWVILDEKVYQSVRDRLKDFEQFILHVRKFLSKDPISEGENLLKQEFAYYKLSEKEKERILNMLKKKLMCYDEVVLRGVYSET